jgi:ankyrin repeat protein
MLVMPDGTTPLMAAAGFGTGRSADRRGRRRDPSDIAAFSQSGEDERQSLEAVKALTELGADVNATNAGGDTAVHAATTRGETTVVQWLAVGGARLEVKNKRGLTPLSIAKREIRGEDYEGGVVDAKMVELLQRLGAKE